MGGGLGGAMAPQMFHDQEKKREKERKGKEKGKIVHYFLNIMSKSFAKFDFCIKRSNSLLARSLRSLANICKIDGWSMQWLN